MLRIRRLMFRHLQRSNSISSRWAVGALLIAASVALGQSDSQSNANSASAEKQFGQLCQGCHGERGLGGIEPRPWSTIKICAPATKIRYAT